MTREEIYSTIYTHEEIYRPPQEEGCACLEVALGCSWGKCLFCDFAKDKFQIHPMAKIEWNLRMLGRLEPDKTRLFLLGENAFVMSCEQLKEIISMTHTFMPNIKEFSMYARIDDVLRKTPEQLRELRELGYQGQIIPLSELRSRFQIRLATCRMLAQEIRRRDVPGAIGELGVYQGEFAEELNRLFPERKEAVPIRPADVAAR